MARIATQTKVPKLTCQLVKKLDKEEAEVLLWCIYQRWLELPIVKHKVVMFQIIRNPEKVLMERIRLVMMMNDLNNRSDIIDTTG